MDDVRALLAGLVDEDYQELAQVTPTVGTFQHRFVFFRSRPSVRSVLWVFGPLRYKVMVNERVLGELESGAARGVLAHELAHTLFYHRTGRVGVLLAFWSLLSTSFRRRFEQRTDIHAILRGHCEGLVQYRTWLRDRIGSEEYGRRMRFYYSEQEIRTIAGCFEGRPELRSRWFEEPPERPDCGGAANAAALEER